MIYQAAFEKGAESGNFFYIIVCVFALPIKRVLK
jgi:hypothetical protein